MAKMEKQPIISEDKIKATLFGDGASIEDYFISYLVGEKSAVLPIRGNAAQGWNALLIEDDALAAACVKYLVQHGAKEIPVDQFKQKPAVVSTVVKVTRGK
jgi:hypothetical protein